MNHAFQLLREANEQNMATIQTLKQCILMKDALINDLKNEIHRLKSPAPEHREALRETHGTRST